MQGGKVRSLLLGRRVYRAESALEALPAFPLSRTAQADVEQPDVGADSHRPNAMATGGESSAMGELGIGTSLPPSPTVKAVRSELFLLTT